jgi:hypothetical protein
MGRFYTSQRLPNVLPSDMPIIGTSGRFQREPTPAAVIFLVPVAMLLLR